jgi:starch synthase (maltosyl-transferring)
MNIHPVVDAGSNSPRRAAKATLGEPQPISATIFREGHDRLRAEVVLTDPSGTRRPPIPMVKHGEIPDHYTAWITPDLEGAWSFEIQAWSDPLGTWEHDAGIKIPAGVDVDLMFTEGRLLFERVLKSLPKTGKSGASALRQLVRVLPAIRGRHQERGDRQSHLGHLQAPRPSGCPPSPRWASTSSTCPDPPDRRGQPQGPQQHPDAGTGRPRIALGDRLQDGGHDAIHPDLGTFKDFDAFVAARTSSGSRSPSTSRCSAPDHPWATEHPEWFTTRADGTIAYAENPPKKYQDIYPINFDNDPEPASTPRCCRIVQVWIRPRGQDLPRRQPAHQAVEFWERLLGEIRRTDPDVIFLAEAFTRPAMMRALGSVGYHQSYTYFTWRTEKGEIEDYLRELASETDHLMRPNFFVNTPDILHEFLQYGGPAAFKIRAALASMSSPSWGVYAGYELFEHVAIKPGSEEYLDSEKFQIRIRDWEKATAEGRTLAPYLTRLNEIRRAHPALQQLRNITIHRTDDDHILAFSKSASGFETPASAGSSTTGGAGSSTTGGAPDTVIVVINLDPHGTRETTVHLDMPALGLEWDDSFVVHDEITGDQWTWGERNYVRLDPHVEPAHILAVRNR